MPAMDVDVQAWSGEERCGGSRTGGAGSSGTAARGTPSAPPTGSASGGRPAWSSGSTTAGTTPTVIIRHRRLRILKVRSVSRPFIYLLSLFLFFLIASQGLVEALTGEKRVLETLRSGMQQQQQQRGGAAVVRVPLSLFSFLFPRPSFSWRTSSAGAVRVLNLARDSGYGFQFFGDVACA